MKLNFPKEKPNHKANIADRFKRTVEMLLEDGVAESMKDMAEKIETDLKSLEDYVAGKVLPPSDVIARLCEAFSINPMAMLLGRGEDFFCALNKFPLHDWADFNLYYNDYEMHPEQYRYRVQDPVSQKIAQEGRDALQKLLYRNAYLYFLATGYEEKYSCYPPITVEDILAENPEYYLLKPKCMIEEEKKQAEIEELKRENSRLLIRCNRAEGRNEALPRRRFEEEEDDD